jgi:two-component system sensor histidine kinase/response regulator
MYGYYARAENAEWDRTMQIQGKILAVDDDPNNIFIIEELLKDHYDLKVAMTGEQALEIAQKFQPDIILLDIMMPGMNGYEVCRRLREYNTLKHTKIIMVSARAMVSERLEGYKAGADDYITKPFDGDEFLVKMRIYLHLERAEEVEQIRYEVTITAMESLRTLVLVAKNIISIVTSSISAEVAENIFKKTDPKLRHQFKVANECMEHLEKTISNIIDISEIYAGKVELQKTLFSIQSVVTKVVNQLKLKTTLTMINFNTDMPTEDILVNADRGKIAKILEYLTGNIIRVAHEGDSIYIRVEEHQDKIGVNIEGNRRTVEGSEINELFNQSVQIGKYIISGRNSINFELAVAKGLVELHGGGIWAENRPEGGTVFSFEIPILTEAETTVEPVLSGVGVNSGICEQLEQVNTESKYTI